MKHKVTAEQYAKMSPEFQAEYSQDADGGFTLSVEGLEDTGALRRAKDNEVNARKTAEQKVRDLTAQLAEATESTTTAVTAEANKHKATTEKLSSFARNALVNSVASQLASSISDSPSLLVPVITARLMADIDADVPVTRVIGADGKVSKATLDDLKAEIVANKEYSGIIRVSKTSGGGATRQPSNGGAGQHQQQQKPNEQANLAKMSPKDLVAEVKARQAERAESQ